MSVAIPASKYRLKIHARLILCLAVGRTTADAVPNNTGLYSLKVHRPMISPN